MWTGTVNFDLIEKQRSERLVRSGRTSEENTNELNRVETELSLMSEETRAVLKELESLEDAKREKIRELAALSS